MDGVGNDMAVELPNIEVEAFGMPIQNVPQRAKESNHKPRVLLLYGSVRERSYSRLLALEAQRLLDALGAESRIFDPRGLPQPFGAPATDAKVAELHKLVEWSEGQVWCSPECHGAMSGILKAQLDWIPLSVGTTQLTQGKTLAVMQVCGGSQSFNAVNQMRMLGRWMRMFVTTNHLSVGRADQEFSDDGCMEPSCQYDRLVDVAEELVKFTLLLRDRIPYLVDRYSERKNSARLSKAGEMP